MERIKTKFNCLFSGHYKMERFGIMFGVLSICMVILLTTIVIRKSELDEQTLGTQILYTDTFDMSLSGISGSVVDVVCSDDRTKCFIMLKWDDISKVVTDANQYQIFLTGSDLDGNKRELLSGPAAGIYMFGTTGYMGIYLLDTNGFPSQILDIVVRCNRIIGDIPESIPVYDDASFSKNDQFRIYVNPGASDYKASSFLNENRMGIFDIFEEIVIRPQEQTVCDTLNSDLQTMQSQLNLIKEYRFRLEQMDVIVPNDPIEIKDDSVVANDDGVLYLKTSYIVDGGYDFNWQTGSVMEGYLDDITPDDMTGRIYVQSQSEKSAKSQLDLHDLTWVYADGRNINLNLKDPTGEIDQIRDAITDLTTAWNTYYATKVKYQTTDIGQLLVLELICDMVTMNYTINSNADNITLW